MPKYGGNSLVEKSLSFFLSFFSKATQVVFKNSIFDFWSFFRNCVRQKAREVGPTRSSARLKQSFFFYFFRALLNFFNRILEYAIHFICISLRFLFNGRKFQVPFECVHRWHDCMSIKDTVKVPTDINCLSLWRIFTVHFILSGQSWKSVNHFPSKLAFIENNDV